MLETALLVGGAFGIRHAFEPDHVAAVSTLVDEDRRSISTGAAWGIGHSLPVIALGALFLLLDVEIPAAVGTGFELLVAGVLIALGVRAI
ncbi:high-affinity nickel-transporter protein, partial [Halobium palmae]